MIYKLGIVLDRERGLDQYLINNIEEVLKGVFAVDVFYYDHLTSMDHCDLILVMIKERILGVLPYVRQSEKIITVKRSLKKEDFLMLKSLKKEEIIVVNDTEETALNLVVTFHKLGLNHIKWVPYFEGMTYDTDLAITANERHLVPKDMETIDLGFRPVDMSTLLEMIAILDLDIKDYYDLLLAYQKKYMTLEQKSLTSLQMNVDMMKLQNVLKDANKKSGHISRYHLDDIITDSDLMHQMIIKAKKLSKHDINVLIYGESGTGKELIAQGIHDNSYRKDLPFVGVNVTAIPNNLLESELFGYVAGAFTGAKTNGHKGLFEQCYGGSLFLDEIGDMPIELQGKLLRALEEQCIRPVGGLNLIKTNVRIISATNKDLLKEIEKGQFREDLYYRLKAAILVVPPLREREGDIDVLLQHFLGKEYHLTDEALSILKSHAWKGNVRELKHACDYCKIMCEHQQITSRDLPDDLISIPHESLYVNFNKIYWVLESISELSQIQPSVGRQAILMYLEQENLKMGESELKSILKWLKDEMYILQGRGRKGSVITHKGELFLSNNVQ